MGKTEKNGKRNHPIKVTKIPKTNGRKYGMNNTLESKQPGFWKKKSEFCSRHTLQVEIKWNIFNGRYVKKKTVKFEKFG